MNKLVTAIYENGVLRPLTPLALPEQAQVQIYVQPLASSPEALAHRHQVQEALVEAGLSLSRSDLPPVSLLSVEQRTELARRFSVGPPLSEIIIEEREGR